MSPTYAASPPAKTQKGFVVIDGHELTVTNPNKPLWPEPGITKLEFLDRLIALSPYLLSYTSNRYLTTIRWPHGVEGESFYQKNCPKGAPEFVKTATFGDIRYIVLDSLPTLVWLGNLACLEFHPSLHYIGDELPAEWLIDIDPTLEEEPRIMEAAKIVVDLLASLRIQSVAKTSGATGVQIYVPIRRGYTFEQLRAVGKFLAEYLVQAHPKLFTVERLKKDRGTLIYFDYLQHWHGKTLSAPYTPRAKRAASVSTPLFYDELHPRVKPSDFHLRNIEARLAAHGDLIRRVPPQSLDHVLSGLR
ncbi:non-homologous end-joining DNA ligase [Paenibacillus sp.]|uniref:non-homologous end-joining DNA ligase n=1 Tax=Paenibacillus sp. TaxID=58172 RepID=UPI002D257ECC|nr:non-homologous end-joining DNA ligase [Paenibacillus sp.]HZG55670.1 non-homologous end-joining DNA ligase [Paenibacillus sp.]